MSNLGMTWNPNEVAPDSGIPEPVPAGSYLVHAVESDVRIASSGKGKGASFLLEILDGDLAGRKIPTWFNTQHQSVQAQQIGQAQLSAMCHACGMLDTLTDTQQLHNRPFMIDVIVKDSKEYGKQNNIKKFYSAGGPGPETAGPAPAPTQPTQTAAPCAAVAGAKKPWED